MGLIGRNLHSLSACFLRSSYALLFINFAIHPRAAEFVMLASQQRAYRRFKSSSWDLVRSRDTRPRTGPAEAELECRCYALL